jgi:hypothetical protein
MLCHEKVSKDGVRSSLGMVVVDVGIVNIGLPTLHSHAAASVSVYREPAHWNLEPINRSWTYRMRTCPRNWQD